MPDALLVEGLQDVVPRPVGGVARPAHGPLAVVAGVAAEPALVDQSLGGAVERQAQVLELDDRLDRVMAHHLGRVLVDQVVAALDRVEPVPLPVVLLGVAERGAHAALGRPGVRSRGIQLADDADAGLRPEVALQLQRGVQPGPPGADHHRVQVVRPRPRPAAFGLADEGHENGPMAGAPTGSKVTITKIPSSSQMKVMASRIPISRLRSPPRSM